MACRMAPFATLDSLCSGLTGHCMLRSWSYKFAIGVVAGRLICSGALTTRRETLIGFVIEQACHEIPQKISECLAHTAVAMSPWSSQTTNSMRY